MYRPVQNTPLQGNSVRNTIFSQKNYDTLHSILINDFQQRNNTALSDQQVDRLSKTLDHYIKQIYSVQGDKPVTFLNKEILTASAQDFAKYLQRKDISTSRPVNAVKTVMDESLFHDTSQRFEKLAQERNEVKALPPAIPDFRISLNEEGPTSVDLYERAKKQRELEALRQSQSIPETIDLNIQKYVNANDQFNTIQARQNRDTELALYERRNQKHASTNDIPLTVMPDRRELLLAPIGSFEESTGPRELGNANSNMTIVQPEFNDSLKRDLPQNYVQKEDKIVSYREVENNLFIYSADRDWLRNTKENRYNFTVNFDPANNGHSFGPNPAAQMKFKNIVRIELVKTIIPAEGLDVLLLRDSSDAIVPNITTFQENVLSFPYITVGVAELENNNYGTDNFLDRSFGVLQYDANWVSDSAAAGHHHSRGYLAMIPKFLKCQKEYYPTPLSTLQKMTIDLRRPNGELISHTPDTFNIANILGSDWTGNMVPLYDVDFSGSNYAISGAASPAPPATAPAYFYIRTETFFSRFQIGIGDRIQLNGFTFSDVVLNSSAYGQQLRDFANWINSIDGHIVAGIGYNNGTVFIDGPNNVGYANYIIIQARYNDPTSGSTNLLPFGQNISADLADNYTELLSPRRLIDHNKQLSLVFRIITREMDANPQLRPDNNY